MRLLNMNWPKVDAYFEKNDMVIIAIGSIESHGRHMPVGTDTIIPDFLLDKIEKNTNVMICPTIPYGATQSLSKFPGTIDLGTDGLHLILSRVCDSLFKMGARKFVILNGHGGNIKTIDSVALDFQERGAIFAELNWWLMAWDLNPKWKGGHGGGEETSAILGIDPSLVDKSEIKGPLKLHDVSSSIKATGFSTFKYKGVTINIPRFTSSVTDSGWIGPDHPSTASEEWGTEMLQATSDYISDFLVEFAAIDIKESLRSYI